MFTWNLRNLAAKCWTPASHWCAIDLRVYLLTCVVCHLLVFNFWNRSADDLPINYLYVCSICEEGDIKCKNQQFVLSLWTTGLMLCIYWSYSEHLFFIFNLSESCRQSKNMLNTMRVKASLYPQKRNLERYIGTTLSNCL